MKRGLLAIVLLLACSLPPASASTPFVADIIDPRGDVRFHDPMPYPSSDILRASSTLIDGRVYQRVEMAARPIAPDDSILVRSWFRNSTNGSFFAVDMPIDGGAPDPSARFKPVLRRETFENATPIDARYGLVNSTWVFEFNASVVEDAACFTLNVVAVHTPKRALQGFDSLDANGDCETGIEPIPEMPPLVEANIRRDEPLPAPPSATPPGSETPAAGTLLALVGALCAAMLVAWSRRARRR